jgi:hypothetical protein
LCANILSIFKAFSNFDASYVQPKPEALINSDLDDTIRFNPNFTNSVENRHFSFDNNVEINHKCFSDFAGFSKAKFEVYDALTLSCLYSLLPNNIASIIKNMSISHQLN